MSLLKMLAAGALGFFAYKTWQRSQDATGMASLRDDGGTTAPHGDPLLAGSHIDVEPPPHAGAHSSRSFGEP